MITSQVEVSAADYLSIPQVERVRPRLSITLSNHSYLPRLDNLESDWVAHVTVPAFKLFRQQRGRPVGVFCSIGTGSGLDVLAAIELLGVTRVGLTDVHPDIVSTAVNNVEHNHVPEHPVLIQAGHGDLLEPLRRFNPRYGLIYENLPNVPGTDDDLVTGRKSSSYVPPRKEKVPESVRREMLDLHYLALVQAKDFLTLDGTILSIIGSRVPLGTLLSLSQLAGYRASFLTYSWKVQADPEEIIRDHAAKQKEGFGPFYFYRAEVLRKVFSSIDLAISGRDALEIEKALLPHRLDAVTAYEAFRRGEQIGHTVAVLKSETK